MENRGSAEAPVLTFEEAVKQIETEDAEMRSKLTPEENQLLEADRAGYDGPYTCSVCGRPYWRSDYVDMPDDSGLRKKLYTYVESGNMRSLTCLVCAAERYYESIGIEIE